MQNRYCRAVLKNAARKFLGSPLTAGVGVATLVFLGMLMLFRGGYLESLELGAYDWLIRLRPTVPVSSERIALITIGESDIRELDQWPVPDGVLAQVLERLSGYQPRAIGLDIYRDVPVPPGREELDAVLTRYPNIVVAMKFGNGGDPGIPPPPILRDTAQVGFNDILVDPGGIVRRGLLFLDVGEASAYSFALRLALLYLKAHGIVERPDPLNPERLRLGLTTIPPFEANDGGYVGADARGYQFLLDFRDSPEVFPRYSLTALRSGEVDPGALRDKIVLIGTTAQSVKDFFYVPRSRGLRIDQEAAGIALHAQMASQLLRFALEGHLPIATLREWQEAVWILLWSLMGALIGLRGLFPTRFSLVAASGLLTLGAAVYVSFLGGWWIPLVSPALAWLLSATLVTAYTASQEKWQRALLMSLFSRYVSSEIADEIWQHREELLSMGRPRSQKLVATVLFTDLQGFTPLAEKLEPRVLMDWLNEYLEAMTPLIAVHGGVVIRFMGDAILAAFGVPIARTTEAEIRRDAINAVQCGLAMERKLVELNHHWQVQDLPVIGMRIGIYTGPMVAGSLGSERMEYTVHGDIVNTAARLESFDKGSFMPDYFHRPCRVLIGEATLAYLDDRFQTDRVGEVRLRGKDRLVGIYQVLCQEGETTVPAQKSTS